MNEIWIKTENVLVPVNNKKKYNGKQMTKSTHNNEVQRIYRIDVVVLIK